MCTLWYTNYDESGKACKEKESSGPVVFDDLIVPPRSVGPPAVILAADASPSPSLLRSPLAFWPLSCRLTQIDLGVLPQVQALEP